eukprot:1212064-Amphidinium_carterae.2
MEMLSMPLEHHRTNSVLDAQLESETSIWKTHHDFNCYGISLSVPCFAGRPPNHVMKWCQYGV